MSIEKIENAIYLIRGQKVMLDSDLAYLYGVMTKVLIQSIKRNKKRFPNDFMFQLSREEFLNLRSQFVTSKTGGRRYYPYAFTEQGIAMLSSILNSERAIQVHIQIIRTFTKLRHMLVSYEDLRRKIETMEKKSDQRFRVVFEAIKQLIETPKKKVMKIGFLRDRENV